MTKRHADYSKTAALIGALILVLAGNLSASTITFATFQELANGGNLFEFTNSPLNNHPTGGTLRTLNAQAQPVDFSYLGVSSLPVELQGDQLATISLYAPTTQSVQSGLGLISQPLNSIVIAFTRVTAYKGFSNLLTVTVAPGDLSNGLLGTKKGVTANLTADTTVGDTVLDQITYSSDFLTFSPGEEADLSLAFSSASPCFTNATTVTGACVTSGLAMSFLHSLTMAGSGSFAAVPSPISVFAAPEPDAAFFLFTGLAAVLGFRSWVRRNR